MFYLLQNPVVPDSLRKYSKNVNYKYDFKK